MKYYLSFDYAMQICYIYFKHTGEFMENKDIIKQDKEYKKYILEKIEEYNTNGKKTIAYFCDTFYPIIDGVIKVLDNYAKLLKDKYNIVVIAPKHKGMVSKQDYLVIGVKSLYFKFVGYDLSFPGCDNFVKKALRLLKIDIVHAHSPFTIGKLAAKTAKKKNTPFIMTMHSQYKQDFYKHTKSKLLTKILTDNIVKVFSKSDEVWTMNNKTAETLQGYGYKGNFFLIPNATEYVPFDKPEQYNKYINSKYDIKKNQLVFLFIGRLIALKNIHFIVDSLKIVKDSGIDFKMIFVGSGPDEESLKKQIKELNLQDCILLTGTIKDREELAKIITRSDLFLFPSIYDVSSLVQIEAAAFNTPAVLINGSLTSATITDNVNGFLSENSVDAFAEKIIEISNDKEKLKEIGKQAHKDLYITWPQVATKASERYEYWIEKFNNDTSNN